MRTIKWLATGAVVILVAGAVGLLAWNLLIASAPLYSFNDEEDFGNGLYYPLLVALAFAGGYAVPTHAPLVGVALGLPGLLLSPWTAPRGDNDGLWVFIVPMLGGFVALLGAIAFAGGSVRVARDGRRGP